MTQSGDLEREAYVYLRLQTYDLHVGLVRILKKNALLAVEQLIPYMILAPLEVSDTFMATTGISEEC